MNKQKRMINTPYYEYTNVNPFGKYGGDCVVRAIALMTNEGWAQTIHNLTDLGIKKGFIVNDQHLYPKYLESLGFKEMLEPRDRYNKKITVKEFINQNPHINCVANVGSHHVTAIKDGKVRDIWNCSNETMHKYWVCPDVNVRG